MTEEADGLGNDEGVVEKFQGDNVRSSWPFSLHTIRTNISHCSPEGKEALVAAFLWCNDAKHPMRKEEFARRVGYSDSVIYKLFSGKYKHPETGRQMDVPPDLVQAIQKFIELERERYMGQRGVFVTTPTAKKIWTACDLARESQTPVFLWGPSHCGKTLALEAYKADNNHGRTIYVRMKAASGLSGMVKRMCTCLGVSPNSGTGDLIDRIKNALTPNMLVVFDEMHLLMYTYRKQSFFACMEVVREIYDEVECGMVLCGTRLLEEKLNEGKSREMEQLLRRGVHRVGVHITKGDVACIVKHWGLEFPQAKLEVTVQDITEKPYELLRVLTKHHGMKAVTERLRYAKKLSHRDGKKMSWAHFVDAHLTIAEEEREEREWE